MNVELVFTVIKTDILYMNIKNTLFNYSFF